MSLAALRNNPMRAPHWKWLRALSIDGGGPNATKRRDGADGVQWVRRAIRLKRHHAAACNNQNALYNLAQIDNELFWAHNIWAEDKQPTRWAIEARILAGESDEDIAVKVGCEPAVIAAYESVFFNVRDKLANTGYIVNVVMAESVTKGITERQYDLLWKMFGYTGGPYVLDAVITRFSAIDRPQKPEDVSEFFQNATINSMRHKASVAALTVPINSHTQLAVLDSYVKYIEIERSSDNSTQTQVGIVQNIGAMMQALPFKLGTRADSDASKLPFDDKAAELSSAELMIAATGGTIENKEDIENLRFPGE